MDASKKQENRTDLDRCLERRIRQLLHVLASAHHLDLESESERSFSTARKEVSAMNEDGTDVMQIRIEELLAAVSPVCQHPDNATFLLN